MSVSRAPDTLESLLVRTKPGHPWYGPDLALGPCQEGDGGACRYGYRRHWYWITGLGRQVPLTAHLLTWLLDHLGPLKRDELFLAYIELRASGLVIDHICENTPCINPAHLQPLTQSENIAAIKERQYRRDLARGPVVHYEDDPVDF